MISLRFHQDVRGRLLKRWLIVLSSSVVVRLVENVD
jgi:hypothetical protein